MLSNNIEYHYINVALFNDNSNKWVGRNLIELVRKSSPILKEITGLIQTPVKYHSKKNAVYPLFI